jgi:hypothetical protein
MIRAPRVTRARLRVPPPAPVVSVRPANPALWRAAVRRAGGDPLRVVVRDPATLDIYPDRASARRGRALLTCV